ncbi:hypothetical protein Bca52824_051932 [Brassica carinata]|uniref:Uncharacterized protein n=1 Tax=Brassica carinata TaxID=52824 RepID=A0A8X7UJ75_BRACI|nr:hypothetical protein Bca52824_051932 [Brassica carinata]
METTIGAHRGTGDSSSPQDSSAVTEPTAQPDALISATVHPGITSTQLAAMTISDHLGNTSTLMATTSGKPSMVATSDHPANTSTIVTTTSTQPSMVTTSALPAAVTTSRHPADTTSLIPTTSVPNTRTTYSTQPDISLIFQTLLGRIDELIICNNRINELQSVEIGRVLFSDLRTPVTGSGQQQSIQANDLRAPIANSGQQHQNHGDPTERRRH